MPDAPAELQAAPVELDDVPVLYRACADFPDAIGATWRTFETAVGLRGRKFYGFFDPVVGEYRVCVRTQPGDDPAALEAQEGTIPGGRYLRVRLHGEAVAMYSQIAPTFEQMERMADVDPGRPFIEYYRRSDRVDLMVPIKG